MIGKKVELKSFNSTTPRESGLKQRIEKMRGPRLHWKPKQGGTRMKKRVLTELDKTIAEIKEILSHRAPEYNYTRELVLKTLDSEEGK